MKDDLERAIELATHYHRGQVDKAGQPYILHPMRVMMQMDTIEEMMVAVLHDILEDTKCDYKDLRDNGFSDGADGPFISVVIEPLRALTRKYGEKYYNYMDRVKQNRVAIKVKLADLRDNMNMDRMVSEDLTERDIKRLVKYYRYYNELSRIYKV